MFLSFINCYKKLIKNIKRIATPLILILQMNNITSFKILNINLNNNKKNYNVSGDISHIDSRNIDKSIKNLSIVAILFKSKNFTLVKSKKPDLTRHKNDFAKIDSARTNFLSLKAKKAFIYQENFFIKFPILKCFDLEHYIWIETNILKYTICKVLNQMRSDNSDHHFFDHVANKYSTFSKSEIGQ